MQNLSGKNILYLGHEFFGYYKDIIENLTNNFGANVEFYGIRPKSIVFRILKFNRATQKFYLRIFFNKIFRQIRLNDYDYILIIGSEDFHHPFIVKLKEKFSGVFVMYQWDSKKKNKYDAYIELFDKVFSFDPQDCILDKRLNYLPLFYKDVFNKSRQNDAETQFDLLHIGSGDYERLLICKEIEKQAKEKNKVFYYYLYLPFLMFLRLKIFDKRYRKFSFSDLRFKKMTDIEIARLISKTKAVLDVERFGQSGLTMRTIETIGASKILITTNKNIANERIYTSDFIQILDRNNPLIDWSFSQKFVIPNYYEKEMYSLTNWVLNIFVGF